MGPSQSSEVASDLSGLEAGRFELEDEENTMARRGRFQDSANPGQGPEFPQGPTFVDARSIQAIQAIRVGIPPEVAHQTATQFADTVRSATIAEAELRHNQVVNEERRVSRQNARDEAIAVQDMARASMEHTQNVGARIAEHVRSETLAEAESSHQQILRETVELG